MAPETRHLMDEADIGSGEKSPGQQQVENDVRAVHGTRVGKPLDGSHQHDVVEEQGSLERRPAGEERPTPGSAAGEMDRVLQSGTHRARMVAHRLPDDSYEAQVFVRLTREPDVAETYIPAGNFVTEAEAWAAAEERARRALREHEF